jgi:hypothetical protein
MGATIDELSETRSKPDFWKALTALSEARGLLASFDETRALRAFKYLQQPEATFEQLLLRGDCLSIMDVAVLQRKQPVRNSDWVKLFATKIPVWQPELGQASRRIAKFMFVLLYLEQGSKNGKEMVDTNLADLRTRLFDV